MKICYFGNYDTEYGRTKVLRKGLVLAGVDIIDCHSEHKGWRFWFDLYKKHKVLSHYDLLFIGCSGPSNFIPLFAQIITRKPVVWEPLFSIYDNWVYDRKVVKKYSFKALYYYLMDYISARASDLIVLDTRTHSYYFTRTFGTKPEKLIYALVGANSDIFIKTPTREPDSKLELEYHGRYIPVQGTDVIVKAAALLKDDPDIHITMIGGGQKYNETKELAKSLDVNNITFIPFKPPEEVLKYVRKADACFGLLGDVPRVNRSIPNKLYEAAAVGRVSISADTAALREVFSPGENVLTIPAGDHFALSKVIKELKSNGNSTEMGERAFDAYYKNANTKCIGEQLKSELDYLLKKA